jgi:hypothetical protein
MGQMLRTDSLNKAAFLICKDNPLQSFDWVTDNLCIFQFTDDTKVQADAKDYDRGGKVVAKKYADCISNLKKDMHKARTSSAV